MKSKVPHNVLTLSEMTKRRNSLSVETMPLEDIILSDDTIRKLRASSSMFQKTYVQITYGGEKYNIERVDRQKNGNYRIGLINTNSTVILRGTLGSNLDLVSRKAI
ncbi:MAG: hypothetical protein K6D94_06910 [Clostridiales bacterium]|nr:hypothetical protein [Clostridiales bacterium]